MAFSRIQQTSGTNITFASTVTTTAFGSDTTAGNILIAIAEADTVAANGITVTDSKGNSWTRVDSESVASTFDLELWYTVITTGGSSHTVTATDTGGGVDSLLIVEEWSGQSVSPADKNASAQDDSGSSTALDSSATTATAQANELIIGAGVCSGAITLTEGATFSNKTQVNTVFSTLAFESKTVSVIGTYNATFTASAGGSWACIVATFKDVNPGGGKPTVLSLTGVGS